MYIKLSEWATADKSCARITHIFHSEHTDYTPTGKRRRIRRLLGTLWLLSLRDICRQRRGGGRAAFLLCSKWPCFFLQWSRAFYPCHRPIFFPEIKLFMYMKLDVRYRLTIWIFSKEFSFQVRSPKCLNRRAAMLLRSCYGHPDTFQLFAKTRFTKASSSFIGTIVWTKNVNISAEMILTLKNRVSIHLGFLAIGCVEKYRYTPWIDLFLL